MQAPPEVTPQNASARFVLLGFLAIVVVGGLAGLGLAVGFLTYCETFNIPLGEKPIEDVKPYLGAFLSGAVLAAVGYPLVRARFFIWPAVFGILFTFFGPGLALVFDPLFVRQDYSASEGGGGLVFIFPLVGVVTYLSAFWVPIAGIVVGFALRALARAIEGRMVRP